MTAITYKQLREDASDPNSTSFVRDLIPARARIHGAFVCACHNG